MLGELKMLNTNDNLNYEEVGYWKRQVKSNLKIAVEIESCYDRQHSEDRIIDSLKAALRPTGRNNIFGRCGVSGVKYDGSLSNGVELTTVGRRLNFLDLYEQYKYITNQLFKYNPLMNSRAGLHNHMLMSYDGDEVNSLEKNMPRIIFINLMSLFKRYAPELVWLTSTVNHDSALTRMDKFCKWGSLYQTALSTKSLIGLKSCINSGSNHRYQFVNLLNLKVNENRDEIEKFHIELRFPDGSVYPSQIAAQNMLYGALMLKAIELSNIGTVMTYTNQEKEENFELIAALRNDEGSNRTSQKPDARQTQTIRDRAIEFVKLMKPNLYQYDTKAYTILTMLADKPISLRRRDNTDEEINRYFATVVNSMYQNDLEDCSELSKIMILGTKKGFTNEQAYLMDVAISLNKSVDTIKNQLFRLRIHNEIKFDSELGLLYFK